MENLILSINVVAPICLLLVLGYVVRQLNLFDDHTVTQMNSVSFKAFFSVMMFQNIYTTEIADAFNPMLLAYALGSIFIIFGAMCVLVPIIEKDNKKRGVMIQGIFRSNFVLFGVPVAGSLMGTTGLGATSILIAIVVPTFNVLAIIILEFYRGGKVSVVNILKGISKNPLVLGGISGAIALILNIQLPPFLEKTISDIASITSPLALFLLGASFQFSAIKGNVRNLVIAVAGKLVLVPLIFLPIAVALGFSGLELVSLLVLFASPTAVSSHTMSINMGGDGELAGQIVVFTSCLSVITMFFWIFTLKTMGLF